MPADATWKSNPLQAKQAQPNHANAQIPHKSKADQQIKPLNLERDGILQDPHTVTIFVVDSNESSSEAANINESKTTWPGSLEQSRGATSSCPDIFSPEDMKVKYYP